MAPLSLAFAVTVSWVKISAIFTWSQHHFRVALSRFIRLCLVPKNDLWLSLLFWRCLRVFFFLLLLPLSCYFYLGSNTECCKRPIHNNAEDGMFDVRLIRLRTSYQVYPTLHRVILRGLTYSLSHIFPFMVTFIRLHLLFWSLVGKAWGGGGGCQNPQKERKEERKGKERWQHFPPTYVSSEISRLFFLSLH